ncbi:MAG: HAD-IA family hydrolase [Acidimicrobiaceae bacterium]|jgi:HAD superfamily hydrolase (TIGR01509 family)|nr:HAD-IA family hydrolase [Acidimicrobiaceae bacterium]MBT5579208.1 HAD-IA family hydrolase [Acidimicrobiaceae bacterium]MBT5849742.1 HAD-IA family hydrolase [Acidimicrobiaceae bacterium]MDG1409650.1 HAD-IA family hydrolase [Acidimicrobiales bacterium]MDG2218543.1 HAD-IA family hydrolase [Acidimicrobiales bacterium]
MILSAVIFDFDGTIADTEWPIFEMVRAAYEAHDLEVHLEDWVHSIGKADNRPLHEHLEERLGRPPDADAIEQARAAHEHARYSVPALPGVVQLIEAVVAAGLPLAVASSSPISWVDPHLERLELRRHFAAVRTRDHVDRGKPHPDLFLAAAAALEVDPVETLVIEDSKHGCSAAKAAGMTCIVVPNRITKLDVHPDADIVLDSLLDFPFRRFGL